MSKHTPGPWRYGKLSEEIIAGRGEAIACMPTDRFDYAPDAARKQWEANARLIATAPELLESCKACLPVLGGLLPVIALAHPDLLPGFEKAVKTLSLVIAKAEGREK